MNIETMLEEKQTWLSQQEENRTWLTQHLASCLGEELPAIDHGMDFGHHALLPDQVLAKPIEYITQGRTVETITIDSILWELKSAEIFTKEKFAVACSSHSLLGPWLLWNLSRGRISL
jgi:hypothetical protein